VTEAAKAGDLKAAELILGRIWPLRRGRPVRLELPASKTAADISDAMSAVLGAMAEGEVTPEEAATVTAVLEAPRKALEGRRRSWRSERPPRTGSRAAMSSAALRKRSPGPQRPGVMGGLRFLDGQRPFTQPLG
jgi:hypothetical protein